MRGSSADVTVEEVEEEWGLERRGTQEVCQEEVEGQKPVGGWQYEHKEDLWSGVIRQLRVLQEEAERYLYPKSLPKPSYQGEREYQEQRNQCKPMTTPTRMWEENEKMWKTMSS